MGFGQQARLGSWWPSEAFKLSESFVQVSGAHQHNGDFKLARLLKFNKISINVLSFFFGTTIKCIAASLQNTVVCIATQTSNFRGKEKETTMPPLPACSCLLHEESGGGGRMCIYHGRSPLGSLCSEWPVSPKMICCKEQFGVEI